MRSGHSLLDVHQEAVRRIIPTLPYKKGQGAPVQLADNRGDSRRHPRRLGPRTARCWRPPQGTLWPPLEDPHEPDPGRQMKKWTLSR